MKRARGCGLALLLVAWGGFTVFAFWQMIGRYLRPVSRPVGAAQLRPELHPPVPFRRLETDQGVVLLDNYDGHDNQSKQAPWTLLNFWSPSCPCSRYMEGHVRRLVGRYTLRGVRFVTVVECDTSDPAGEEARAAWHARDIMTPAVADAGGAIARAFGVWAAPAAVLVDPRGQIVYAGAYNVARFCDSDKTAFAAQALEAALAGRNPPHASTPFYGCQVLGARP